MRQARSLSSNVLTVSARLPVGACALATSSSTVTHSLSSCLTLMVCHSSLCRFFVSIFSVQGNLLFPPFWPPGEDRCIEYCPQGSIEAVGLSRKSLGVSEAKVLQPVRCKTEVLWVQFCQHFMRTGGEGRDSRWCLLNRSRHFRCVVFCYFSVAPSQEFRYRFLISAMARRRDSEIPRFMDKPHVDLQSTGYEQERRAGLPRFKYSLTSHPEAVISFFVSHYGFLRTLTPVFQPGVRIGSPYPAPILCQSSFSAH